MAKLVAIPARALFRSASCPRPCEGQGHTRPRELCAVRSRQAGGHPAVPQAAARPGGYPPLVHQIHARLLWVHLLTLLHAGQTNSHACAVVNTIGQSSPVSQLLFVASGGCLVSNPPDLPFALCQPGSHAWAWCRSCQSSCSRSSPQFDVGSTRSSSRKEPNRP